MNGRTYSLTNQFLVERPAFLTVKNSGTVNAHHTYVDGSVSLTGSSLLDAGNLLNIGSGGSSAQVSTTWAVGFLPIP